MPKHLAYFGNSSLVLRNTFERDDMNKIKKSFLFAQDVVRKFIYTDWYVFFVLAIVVSAWAVQNATYGFVAHILVSSVVLAFSDDVLPLLVNAFGAMLMIYRNSLDEYSHLWPTFIPLGVAMAVFIARNVHVLVATKQKFVLGKLFFPQLAVSVALLLGGVGVISKQGYIQGLPNAIALGVGVLAIYLIFTNFTKKDDKIDYAGYFAKVLMWIGLAVCLQMLIIVLRSNVNPEEYAGSYWDIGWGNRNNIATFLLLSAPMTLYRATRSRRGWIFILTAFFQYFCILTTLSRGGILCGFVGFVFGIAFVIYKAPDRKKQLANLAVCVVIVGILCAIGHDVVKGLIASLVDRLDSEDISSGRFDLYKEAWGLFKEQLFLGVGVGYVGDNFGSLNDMGMYWFHSTLFQVLACTGIVGLIAYVYYYIVRIGICIKAMTKQRKFAFFVFVAWVGFEGYSMIDTGTMIPYPNMMLIAAMTYILEISSMNNLHESEFDGLREDLLKIEYKRETAE